MKLISVCILGLLLTACSSIYQERKEQSHLTPDLLGKPDHLHKIQHSGESAIVNVALGVTIGAIERNSFKCKKDCEKQLKESLDRRTQKK